MTESLVEQLGLIGVFIAGAIPWLEAVVVIPAGIVVGLPVLWTVVSALAGNLATIALFAVGSERILSSMAKRRERKGKPLQEDTRTARAKRVFVRYGDVGMAVVGPLLIGTQFAAAIAAVSAQSNIPGLTQNQESAIGVGLGSFMGKAALALGVNHRGESATYRLSVASGVEGGAKPVIGAGASWSF